MKEAYQIVKEKSALVKSEIHAYGYGFHHIVQLLKSSTFIHDLILLRYVDILDWIFITGRKI